MKAYLLRVLVAPDVLAMAVLNGRRNETLSAAAWELWRDGKWQGKLTMPLIDRVMQALGDGPNHCRTVWESENAKKAMS